MFSKREDFRIEAALRSEVILKTRGVDPFDELRGLGVSLCVLIDPDGIARSKSIDRRSAAIYTFAIVQFFVILSAAAWVAKLNVPDWVLTLMVILDVLSGIGAILIFYLRRKKDNTTFLDELRSRPNSMLPEQANDPAQQQTYFVVDLQKRKGENTFAMFRDDQAVIVPDPDHACILIESRGYRHVIYRKDVLLLNPVSNGGSVGVDIIYTVDGIEVPLHMFAHKLFDIFLNYFGRKSPNFLADCALKALTASPISEIEEVS